MGRDFARKGRNKISSEPSNHWLWLLAGTAIGIIISVIALFKLFPVIYPKIAQLELEKAPVIVQQAAPKQEEAAARSPHFDFYSLLPEIEVVVPQTAEESTQVVIANETSETPEVIETAPTSEAGFRIQLGSFRKYEDADRLKAQMALTGIQVEIEAVTLAPNDTWFRVRSTSYPNRESAESVRAQLQAQSIQSLLVEEKG
ncbi:MAG: SPOR domain-containing protein [Legionellales bacterium]|jgi:cell division protein FtsN